MIQILWNSVNLEDNFRISFMHSDATTCFKASGLADFGYEMCGLV